MTKTPGVHMEAVSASEERTAGFEAALLKSRAPPELPKPGRNPVGGADPGSNKLELGVGENLGTES